MTSGLNRFDRMVDATCPTCGASQLRMTLKLESKPIGTFSLSGHQVKFSAYEWAYLVCDADGCDFEKRAKGQGQ